MRAVLAGGDADQDLLGQFALDDVGQDDPAVAAQAGVQVEQDDRPRATFLGVAAAGVAFGDLLEGLGAKGVGQGQDGVGHGGGVLRVGRGRPVRDGRVGGGDEAGVVDAQAEVTPFQGVLGFQRGGGRIGDLDLHDAAGLSLFARELEVLVMVGGQQDHPAGLQAAGGQLEERDAQEAVVGVSGLGPGVGEVHDDQVQARVRDDGPHEDVGRHLREDRVVQPRVPQAAVRLEQGHAGEFHAEVVGRLGEGRGVVRPEAPVPEADLQHPGAVRGVRVQTRGAVGELEVAEAGDHARPPFRSASRSSARRAASRSTLS